MFVGITNTPLGYAWGSHTAIASLLGTQPSGKPEAELWLGAHAGSPSRIVDPAAVGGATDLASWIADAPATALGASFASDPLLTDAGTPRLPFLLKILAAGSPLSLQAHPRADQARAGFELENEAGIPLDAADRNYKDPFHKPELIYALSENFEALCGFRSLSSVRSLLEELRVLDATLDEPQPGALDALERRLAGAEPLRDTVEWLLRDGRGEDSGEVSWLVERVVALAAQAAFLGDGGAEVVFRRELATVQTLAAVYPGDPGIVISLLLNRVSLHRGEVLYLPAGNIHAYLSGLGVELMAASDNVLRGGLTPKHIDVDELLQVLNFEPVPVPYLAPVGSFGSPRSSASSASSGSFVSSGSSASSGSSGSSASSDSSAPSASSVPGVAVYRPDVPDFELVHIEAAVSVPPHVSAGAAAAEVVPMRQFTLSGPGIAICTAGGFLVAGAASSVSLKRGQAIYITPDEGTITFAGAGEVFLATTAT